MTIETNLTNPLRSSDPVDKETEELYDFRRQLKLSVENEWAKTSTNTLEKKNQNERKENQQRKVLPRVVSNFNL